MDKPDLPSAIASIETYMQNSLRILWPCPDLVALEELRADQTGNYAAGLRNLKKKAYKKLVWNTNELFTRVIATGTGYSTLYCVNLSFCTDSSYTDKIISGVQSLNTSTEETQKALHDLWNAIITSQIKGQSILKGHEFLQASIDYSDLAIFYNVPLSPLHKQNCILVLAFGSETIAVDMVLVEPVIHHGYTYQQETELMTGWKAVWNGRPSVFINENYCNTILKADHAAGEIEEGGQVIEIDQYYFNAATGAQVTSLTGLETNKAAIEADIQTLATKLTHTSDSATINELTQQIEAKKQQLATINKTIQEIDTSNIETKAFLTDDAESVAKLLTTIDNQIADLKMRLNSATTQLNQLRSNKADPVRIEVAESEKEALEERIAALEAKKKTVTIVESPEEPADSDPEETEPYSVRDTKRFLTEDRESDPEFCDGGIIITQEELDAKQTIPTVNQLYIPFLNPAKTAHRNIGSYNDKPTLNIPQRSGLTKWGYIDALKGFSSTRIQPKYSYLSQAAKKVIVEAAYEKEVGLVESIGKVYRLACCSGLCVLVLNPEYFNNYTEAMIFSMSASYTIIDPTTRTEYQQTAKFIPFNYTQVMRTFPGYVEGKKVRRVVNQYQVSEELTLLEKTTSTDVHPWVYFIMPVSNDTAVKEWRFYNNIKDIRPYLTSIKPVSLPQDTKTVIEYKLKYAYIKEVWDENDVRTYEWKADTLDTRFAFTNPNSGILHTNFYVSNIDGSTIDGYTSVPIGSSTMATLWPYARVACRDYEITYVWKDKYKGKKYTDETRVGNRNVIGAWAANKAPWVACQEPREFTFVDQGDHDLGVEAQPKIYFNKPVMLAYTTGRELRRTRLGASKKTEEHSLEDVIKSNPYAEFPTTFAALFSPVLNTGANYYPYTRSEPGSGYIPAHPLYLWDFVSSWRNKLEDPKNLGCFRLKATNWGIIGDMEFKTRPWWPQWYYDPNRPTQFIGRSKTRGPVFTLDYREYYEMPTKTIFLRPYGAHDRQRGFDKSSYTCFCPVCNHYFKPANPSAKELKDMCGACPGPFHKDYPDAPKPHPITGRHSHAMMLLTREAESEETVYTDKAELPKKAAPEEKDDSRREKWKTKISSLYSKWSESKKLSDLNALLREVNRGKPYGYLVNIYGGLEFVEPVEPEEEVTAEEESLDLVTGCNIANRKDLGSYQIVDGFVPGSPSPYVGMNDLGNEGTEYKKIEDEWRLATRELQYVESDIAKFTKIKNDMLALHVPWAGAWTEDGITYTLYGQKVVANGEAEGNVKIDDKIAELDKLAGEKRSKQSRLESILDSLGENTSYAKARRDLAQKAEDTRANMPDGTRYYEYVQQSFGYNYPWSPYDSPPLFGNTGRELFIIELCCIGSIISWLPTLKDNPGVVFPTVPSWWTARDPYGEPRELVTLLTPPTECNRSISTTPGQAINPFYYYIMKGPFGESAPVNLWGRNIKELNDQGQAPQSIRILTSYDVNKYGQPNIRMDTGRFVLAPTSDSNLVDIPVVGNSPLFNSESEYASGPPPSFDTSSEVQPADSEITLKGQDIRGFSVANGDKMNVGNYYPGFKSGVDSSKTFVGFKSNIYWAWPIFTHDIVKRGLSFKQEAEEKSSAPASNQQLSIAHISCPGYVKKLKEYNDGFDLSCGPELDYSVDGATKEPLYVATKYYLHAESERVTEDGYRPPLLWLQKEESGITAKIVSQVTEAGSLIPCELGESKAGSLFTTGKITPTLVSNPAEGANLLSSNKVLDNGYYPGLIVKSANPLTLGKIYQFSSVKIGNSLCYKTVGHYGPRHHTITGSFVISKFDATLLRATITLNSFFKSLPSSIFIAKNDGASLEVELKAKSAKGQNPFYSKLIRNCPVDSLELEVMFGLALDLELAFTFHIHCAPDLFNEGGGPWGKRDDSCRLTALVETIELGKLMAGKCCEGIELQPVKFVTSTGASSTHAGETFDFFTEARTSWYEPNWQEYDKKLDRDSGWYEQSGRLEEGWMIDKEREMLEALMGDDSSIGKEPKAQIFPKACIELPELPISRLKLEAWKGISKWTQGGIWTTRNAGPEWVTSDQYPSRDIIWWPALPYDECKIYLKGRAFHAGRLYKDESPVINLEQKRSIESEDPYNQNAYKYETRGFDALLQNIQLLERDEARDRNSLLMQANYGGKRQKGSYEREKYGTGASNTSRGNTSLSQAVGGIRGISDQFQHTNMVSDMIAADLAYQEQRLATDAAQPIQGATATWQTLADIGMKPNEFDYKDIIEREGLQQQLYEQELTEVKEPFEADELTFKFTIPVFDQTMLFELTGGELASMGIQGDRSPINSSDLPSPSITSRAIWKHWSWAELESFTFKQEASKRYPVSEDGLLRGCDEQLQVKYKNKIWDKVKDAWEQYTGPDWKAVFKGVRRGSPMLIKTDCKKVEGKNTNCKDEDFFRQFWDPNQIPGIWPSQISADHGETFNPSSSWWRY